MSGGKKMKSKTITATLVTAAMLFASFVAASAIYTVSLNDEVHFEGSEFYIDYVHFAMDGDDVYAVLDNDWYLMSTDLYSLSGSTLTLLKNAVCSDETMSCVMEGGSGSGT
jgi:hypothetical protein